MSYTPLRYSQNFLRDPRLVERLVTRSSINRDDVVIEIGPGKGILTDSLTTRAQRIVAIELDAALAKRLRGRYAANPRVAIVDGDFLAYPLPRQPYKVFASIPFAHTQEIVTRLTSAACPPDDAYLIMQREAAQKLCGVTREYLYSVLLKPWFTFEIVHHFSRSDFAPAPSVEVVMLRIQKRGPPLVSASERQMFRDFAVYGFSGREPAIADILRGLLSRRQRMAALSECGICPDARPSAINFTQWLQLFHMFARVANPQARLTLAGSEQRLRRQQTYLNKRHRTPQWGRIIR